MGTATTRVKEEANFSFQNEEENNSATLHLSAAINRMLYLNLKKKTPYGKLNLAIFISVLLTLESSFMPWLITE